MLNILIWYMEKCLLGGSSEPRYLQRNVRRRRRFRHSFFIIRPNSSGVNEKNGETAICSRKITGNAEKM